MIRSFDSVLDEHGALVRSVLIGLVGAQEAGDCWQETFLAALRAWPRLPPDSNVRGWLVTIARHKAVDHLRTRKPVPLELVPDHAVEPVEPHDDGLWAAVGRLPPRQREAVTLRFVADLAFREVGAAMGCSDAAARRSAHDGLRTLRRAMQTGAVQI